jgi:septation ring formation regulator EzrA
MAEQLLLFQEKTEEKLLREIENLKQQNEKNRKSLHAKHGRLEKMYMELSHRFQHMEAAICTGKSSNLF